MKNTIKIGERVHMPNGDIGNVDEIDENFAGIRLLTPNNTPSACVSWCPVDRLVRVPIHVVPMPKSAEWWKQSREFCAIVHNAIRQFYDKSSKTNNSGAAILPFRRGKGKNDHE